MAERQASKFGVNNCLRGGLRRKLNFLGVFQLGARTVFSRGDSQNHSSPRRQTALEADNAAYRPPGFRDKIEISSSSSCRARTYGAPRALAVRMHPTPSPIEIDPALAAAVARYRASGISNNTIRAYRSAWRSFESWCSVRAVPTLPACPSICAAYLADRAGSVRPSSLTVHLAAIRQAHVARGLESPTEAREVTEVLKGIRREHGTAPTKKTALTPAQLTVLVNALGTELRDCRDRALLLLGFCAGFRRSELVGLDVPDVVFREEGLLVRVRRSKTDQEQRGRTVAVEYGVHATTCPGTALEDWLAIAGIRSGPIFRAIDRHGSVGRNRLEGRAVARVLRGRAAAAGLNAHNLSGHSLRSGLATAAALAHVDERDIARRTGHKNLTVMRGYIQDANAFGASLTQRLGF